jgi:hypothetical protein
MAAVHSYETSLNFYRTTRRHILAYDILESLVLISGNSLWLFLTVDAGILCRFKPCNGPNQLYDALFLARMENKPEDQIRVHGGSCF